MGNIEQTLHNILGESGWLPGETAERYSRDWLNRYGVPPLGVARPASTEQVSQVVAACYAADIPVVPQGGNTGLCGSSVCESAGTVILSLERMSAIGSVDRATGSVAVQAGVILQALHESLVSSGYIFPVHLGSESSAQIGGLISTNAGGSHAFRYGMMQDLVLGLEVVLADGRVWNGMRAVQKDNAGYQLRKLFCGAEGTLGIVTRAVLRLHPAAKQQSTALLSISDLAKLLELGQFIRAEASEFVNGLEFFSDFGLGLALKHVHGLHYPLTERAPWYLLIEMSTSSALVELEVIMENILTAGMENNLITDGTIAGSEAQRAVLWRLREEQPEGQRLEGEQLKHDIAVPPGSLAEFIRAAGEICESILPGIRISPFGHLGDGNVHYNLSAPENGVNLHVHAEAFALSLGRLATDMHGSFAAEHGLGRTKVYLADALRSEVERELMRDIKSALDPKGLLNPSAVTEHPDLSRKTCRDAE